MSLPVTTIIAIAKVSQYLAANAKSKGALFGTPVTPDTAKILYMERKAVEWLYNLDSSDDTLRLTANYLYSLCRGYNLQALNIISSGGGGNISPVLPSNPPSPYDFEVSVSSFIATGDTTKTFPASWQGLEILFIRNHVPQSTVNDGGTYYSWDATTRLFTLLGGAAQSTEIFQIYPVF